MSALMAVAFELASELHAGQVRKGSQVPYLSHLMAVSALVLEDGGGEIAAAGALLHDAAEDQGGFATVTRIREVCGDGVADVVVECSDSIEDRGEAKAPWQERKAAAIAALPSHSTDALLVIAADKLHNARATLIDLELFGPTVWDRFKTGRDGFLWYHDEMAQGLTSLLPQSRSVADLRSTLAKLSLLN